MHTVTKIYPKWLPPEIVEWASDWGRPEALPASMQPALNAITTKRLPMESVWRKLSNVPRRPGVTREQALVGYVATAIYADVIQVPKLNRGQVQKLVRSIAKTADDLVAKLVALGPVAGALRYSLIGPAQPTTKHLPGTYEHYQELLAFVIHRINTATNVDLVDLLKTAADIARRPDFMRREFDPLFPRKHTTSVLPRIMATNLLRHANFAFAEPIDQAIADTTQTLYPKTDLDVRQVRRMRTGA